MPKTSWFWSKCKIIIIIIYRWFTTKYFLLKWAKITIILANSIWIITIIAIILYFIINYLCIAVHIFIYKIIFIRFNTVILKLKILWFKSLKFFKFFFINIIPTWIYKSVPCKTTNRFWLKNLRCHHFI